MKPTLLIMAAGLGSRYGGLKQIDPIGPDGEILLEFALKDAIFLGIEKVVIIVSEAIRADFESMIVPKYQDTLDIQLVIQTMENIPFLPPGERGVGGIFGAKRAKPWGTAHAIWCAKDVITGPFIVMNADDFYGRDALRQAFQFLIEQSTNHCIVTYPITSTLSDYGTVSRGICKIDNGLLVKIVEHTRVEWKMEQSPPVKGGAGKAGGGKNGILDSTSRHSINSGLGWNDGRRLVHTAEDGHEIIIPEDSPANMNLFGFQQSFFNVLHRECVKFFQEFGNDPKREFFLPSVVMQMIREKSGTVTALSTTSQWFGMTYPEDREEAKRKIRFFT